MTPLQEKTLKVLRGGDRPTWPSGFAGELRADLDARLQTVVDTFGVDDVYVTKRVLSGVHGCQTNWQADRDQKFEWSIPTARGTIAHKAIELWVAWRGEAPAPVLAQAGLDRSAATERGLGSWLNQLDVAERAELEGRVLELVTHFLEWMPPIEAGWWPVAETKIRADFADRAVGVVGKLDWTVGRADGLTAGKVQVDWKSGAASPTHNDDLRLYALLETVKIGVPPRLLVDAYLDSGELSVEPVTEGLLIAAGDRLVDGVKKLAGLQTGGMEPTVQPGGACTWCPVADGCEQGQTYLQERKDQQ